MSLNLLMIKFWNSLVPLRKKSSIRIIIIFCSCFYSNRKELHHILIFEDQVDKGSFDTRYQVCEVSAKPYTIFFKFHVKPCTFASFGGSMNTSQSTWLPWKNATFTSNEWQFPPLIDHIVKTIYKLSWENVGKSVVILSSPITFVVITHL